MIDLMTHDDFQSLLRGPRADYYLGRWDYFKEVIAIIRTLPAETVLELGLGLLPNVKNADLMLNPDEDQYRRPDGLKNKVIRFTAVRKPWPIADGAYDLFIALQVWEHLDNKQSRAWREVMRIARWAILSFPYRWEGGEDKPSHRAHLDIDDEVIKDWTLGVEPRKRVEIKRTGDVFGKGPRVIYVWDFSSIRPRKEKRCDR